jgi:hypothetical protein
MLDQDRTQTGYEPLELPEESKLRSVTAPRADIAGRRALRVQLTDEVTSQEAAANIGPDEWIKLKIDIDDTHLSATINDTESLSVTETKAAPVAGDVGLFVDIGSESFFSNLKITRR